MPLVFPVPTQIWILRITMCTKSNAFKMTSRCSVLYMTEIMPFVAMEFCLPFPVVLLYNESRRGNTDAYRHIPLHFPSMKLEIADFLQINDQGSQIYFFFMKMLFNTFQVVMTFQKIPLSSSTTGLFTTTQASGKM